MNADTRPIIEICCASPEDCALAQAGGADRVELNSALFLGGLTPSLGALMAAKARCDIPIMAMLRPRAGGFCYSDADYEAMLYDARAFIDAGADGLVFGILTEAGEVDIPRNAELCRLAHAAGRDAVFHRAIDIAPDWRKALDALINIGIDRVLTSGQAPSAPQGLETIRAMCEYAADRIQILPGAGINAGNIRTVLSETGCAQAHMSAKSVRRDLSGAYAHGIHLGGALYLAEDSYDQVNPDSVRAITEAIS